jgi:hypothetical protein
MVSCPVIAQWLATNVTFFSAVEPLVVFLAHDKWFYIVNSFLIFLANTEHMLKEVVSWLVTSVNKKILEGSVCAAAMMYGNRSNAVGDVNRL